MKLKLLGCMAAVTVMAGCVSPQWTDKTGHKCYFSALHPIDSLSVDGKPAGFIVCSPTDLERWKKSMAEDAKFKSQKEDFIKTHKLTPNGWVSK